MPLMSMGKSELSNKTKTRLYRIILRLYEDVHFDRLYSPTFKRVMYYNAWRAMSRKAFIDADHKYWSDSGLDNYTYSPDISIGHVKKLFGNIVCSAFGRIIG